MGLNLNIKRVIFTSTTKFDGKEMRPIVATEALQIGGRAGNTITIYEHHDHPCLHHDMTVY
jgi:ATP-dependent RNA helicase SUPV3L1/SUV3